VNFKRNEPCIERYLFEFWFIERLQNLVCNLFFLDIFYQLLNNVYLVAIFVIFYIGKF